MARGSEYADTVTAWRRDDPQRRQKSHDVGRANVNRFHEKGHASCRRLLPGQHSLSSAALQAWDSNSCRWVRPRLASDVALNPVKPSSYDTLECFTQPLN